MLKAHLPWKLPVVEETTLLPAQGVLVSRALRWVWAKRQIPGIFIFVAKSTSSLAHQRPAETCELHERQTKKIPLTVSSNEINNNNFHEPRSFASRLPPCSLWDKQWDAGLTFCRCWERERFRPRRREEEEAARGRGTGDWNSLLGEVAGVSDSGAEWIFPAVSSWDLHSVIWMLLSISENRQEFFPQAAPKWPWRCSEGLQG